MISLLPFFKQSSASGLLSAMRCDDNLEMNYWNKKLLLMKKKKRKVEIFHYRLLWLSFCLGSYQPNRSSSIIKNKTDQQEKSFLTCIGMLLHHLFLWIIIYIVSLSLGKWEWVGMVGCFSLKIVFRKRNHMLSLIHI